MPFTLGKFFKKTKETNAIIIVSGLPRSGTSMMMRMLEAAGQEILTDNIRTANENNPNGYYEFQRVKGLKTGDYDWLIDARGKVVKVISALLEYLPNRYHYKVIFMRRDMGEVLSSQRQMLIRDGIADDKVSDSTLAELYGSHLQKIETWLGQQPNIETVSVITRSFQIQNLTWNRSTSCLGDAWKNRRCIRWSIRLSIARDGQGKFFNFAKNIVNLNRN